LEELKASTFLESAQMDAADVLRLQAGNGMGQEDSQMIIEGMAQQGAEPTYCMGDDTPLPVLSNRPHVLYDYFKQRFAQVRLHGTTSPPCGLEFLRRHAVRALLCRLPARLVRCCSR